MKTQPENDPIEAISAPQPAFSNADAIHTLEQEFGVTGELLPLVSERDQNFHVIAADGRNFVLKIANVAESESTTASQIAVLRHLAQRQCAVATPRIVRTQTGATSVTMWQDGTPYRCRVVNYLAGTPLSAVEVTPQLATSFGRCAAELDLALQDFSRASASQALLWDLQRACELRPLLPHINDLHLRTAISDCLDDFEANAMPVLPSLRRQAIHADLNADNVLADAAEHSEIAGVIDFGDMNFAPLVVEVAIAGSYLRTENNDPLHLIGPFVAAYHSVLPLAGDELALLFDLVRARLAATLSILHWRASTRGKDDEYSRQFLLRERSAESFLLRLAAQGRREFVNQIRSGCDLAGTPRNS